MRTLVLGMALATSLAAATPARAFDYQWRAQAGYSAGDAGKFVVAQAIGADADGNLLVSDSLNRFQKLTAEGKSVFVAGQGVRDGSPQFQTCSNACGPGLPGSGPGQFNSAYGIDSAGNGDIYVADYMNNRVSRFNSSGSYLSSFGSSGSGNGKFDSPVGLAIDSQNNVYVADQGNARVQKFDANGTFLSSIGSPGSSVGQFNGVVGIAIADNDDLYAVDQGNDRIQVFDSDGSFDFQFGTAGTGVGQFDSPSWVAVDPAGDVYVADSGNERIQRLDRDGDSIASWPAISVETLTFTGGRLYASVSTVHGDAIQRYTPAGTPVGRPIGSPRGDAPGEFEQPVAAATDSAGNVYVADQVNHRISKLTNDLVLTRTWGLKGSNAGDLDTPLDIAIDAQDRVIVADTFNFRLQVFDGAGTILAQFNGSDAPSGRFIGLAAVATGPDGAIYVSDAAKDVIQKFSPNGQFLIEWGRSGSGPGEFDSALDLAVDRDGNVYVSDTGNGRVQKFDSNGSFLNQWSTALIAPRSIAVDRAGRIYVGDAPTRTVQIYGSFGTRLEELGSRGLRRGQFSSIGGVALDCAGNVFVTDSDDAARVQKLGDPSFGNPQCPANPSIPPTTTTPPPTIVSAPLVITQTPATAARLSSLAIATGKRGVGANVSFALDKAARVTLTVEQLAKGKRDGKRCKRPTNANRKRLASKPSCMITKRLAEIDKQAAAGKTTLKLSMKLAKRILRVGSYELTATVDGKPAASRSFRVIKR